MKKIIAFLLALLTAAALCACGTEKKPSSPGETETEPATAEPTETEPGEATSAPLWGGQYVSTGDGMGAYVFLNVVEKTWRVGPGIAVSVSTGGDYVIVGDMLTAAEGDGYGFVFRIGPDDTLTAETVNPRQDWGVKKGDSFALKYRYISGSICSADEALRLAKEDGATVIEGSTCTSGREHWESFVSETSEGWPLSAEVVQWYGADVSSDRKDSLFFIDIRYNGEEYEIKVRKSDEETPEIDETFKYLKHETGEMDSNARYKYYDCWFLVDDPEATYDGIIAGMFSSSADAGFRHFIVFREYYD